MSAAPASRLRLRGELIRIVLQYDPDFAGELADDASLIRSGLLDSQRLLDVAVFVEQEIGHQVDFTRIDLAAEWDTVAGILRFIETQRLAG